MINLFSGTKHRYISTFLKNTGTLTMMVNAFALAMKEVSHSVSDEGKAWLTEEYGKLMHDAYSGAFTETELKELVVFSKSDISRKIYSMQETLMQLGYNKGKQIGLRYAGKFVLTYA